LVPNQAHWKKDEEKRGKKRRGGSFIHTHLSWLKRLESELGGGEEGTKRKPRKRSKWTL